MLTQMDLRLGMEIEGWTPENIVSLSQSKATIDIDSNKNFLNKNLLRKIEKIEDFSIRTLNCMRNDNIVFIGDLVKKSEFELFSIPNFGRKTLNEIRGVLTQMNLRLSMKIGDWIPEKVTIDNNKNLLRKIEEIDGLTVRAQNCMKLGKIEYIGDLAQNSEDELFSIMPYNFGKKTLNDIKAILSQMDLRMGMNIEGWPPENIERLRIERLQFFPMDTPPYVIERIILEDISKRLSSLSERDRVIFCDRFGYMTKHLTLEATGRKYNITRERVRQIAIRIERKIRRQEISFNRKFIRNYLKSKEEQSFHKIFPQLDERFTDTVRTMTESLKKDRLLGFLECYCATKERFFRPPERILMEFDQSQLKLIFMETPSPIEYEDFLSSIMEVYGYSESLARAALEFMENQAMIKNVNGQVYPTKLNQYQEVTHILSGYPEGLHWKNLYKLMNKSYTNNQADLKRTMATFAVSNNPDVWLKGVGTYAHIKYFPYQEHGSEILKEVKEIMKRRSGTYYSGGWKEGKEFFLIEETLADVQKNETSKNITFHELRHLLSSHGEEFGIFFKGKSGMQSFSLDKDFRGASNQDIIAKIVNDSKEPISEDHLRNHVSKGAFLNLSLASLMSKGKVICVGPQLWASPEHLKSHDIKSICGCIDELLKEFSVLSVRYITHYVNGKLGLTLSYYSYDSLLRIAKKDTAKLGSYYKGFLTKDRSHFSEESIDEKINEKIDLLENLSKIKKDGIAITRSEFMNIVNRLDAQRERASRS
jgi:hypothetical protein